MGRDEMRGLNNFIADIRACKSQEAEIKRINKELANIRSKFGDKKGVDGYQKKKYVSKLLFIFLLGHEIEFGHMEAVNLMSSLQYSEKQIGYLFASVMLNEQHDLMRLVIQAIKTDLGSRNELHVCLALHCISNIGGKETAEAVSTMVQKLLIASESPKSVQRKAALATLRLFREAPDQVMVSEYAPRIIQQLSSSDKGVVTSVASLIISLAAKYPADFAQCVAVASNTLHKLVFTSGTEHDEYTYYQVPSPWLTVKLLRLLQLYPFPDDSSVANRLNETLSKLQERAQHLQQPSSRKVRSYEMNATNACLVEAINLIAHYDNDASLQIKACTILGSLLTAREVNNRFLALEGLTVMASTEFSHDAVKKHQGAVLRTLQTEKDSTVQRRAADLLYALCDQDSVETIVEQLIEFLKHSDYNIREELVLKIAILAEKYVPVYSWYVDVMLRLIKIAGDYVPQQVWFRVIQVVVNRQEVQDYTAKTCFEALLDPSAHETMVMLKAVHSFSSLNIRSMLQDILSLEALQLHYPMVSGATRAALLTTYAKLANIFPELKSTVLQILQTENLLRNSDSELQQRGNEYVQLLLASNASVVPAVLEEMPPFNEDQCSILLKLEDKSTADVADGATGQLAARKRQSTAPLQAVTSAGHTGIANTGSATIVGNDQFFGKFIFTNNGVLYENPVLQIGVKSEFSGSVGRLTILYGNRGDSPMTNLSTRVYAVGNMQALKVPQASLHYVFNITQLNLQSVENVVSPGVQLQQLLQVECNGCFSDPPVLEATLTYQGRPVVLNLKLPVLINKFIHHLPSPLNGDTFFQKWNQLGGPPREVQQIVKAKEAVDPDNLKTKVAEFGLQILQGIDRKPTTTVAAGILHTSDSQFGVLLRAEPSIEAQMYRFTIRSSSDVISNTLAGLLLNQF